VLRFDKAGRILPRLQSDFLSDGTATRDLPDLGFGPVSAEETQKVVLTVLAMSFAQV